MTDAPLDVVVVGGGPGGYAAAIRAAQNGLSTALVEKTALGGTCLNLGCIPTKALLRSAEAADAVHETARLGVHCGEVRLDYGQAQRRSVEVVRALVQGVEGLMRKHRIRVVRGLGTLAGAGRVSVRGAQATQLQARHVILATGSVPRPLPGLPFDGRVVISSDDAVQLQAVPRRIAIIGAGPIGLEFACVLRAFGSKVTVIEMQQQIAPLEDAETAGVLADALKRRGIALRLGCGVERVELLPQGARVHLQSGKGSVEADQVLVAIGRLPFTEGLALEAAGVRSVQGCVPVDARMRSAVPGIWAIGDITGGPMLAHRATHQALLAADAIAGTPVHPIDPLNIPSCIYTHPQLASVGLTEAQARAAGHDIQIARFPLRASGKALAMAQADDLVKLVCGARHGEILGAHLVGPEATELISELVLARTHELTARDIAAAIHPHPTLAEAVGEAALGVLGAALHA